MTKSLSVVIGVIAGVVIGVVAGVVVGVSAGVVAEVGVELRLRLWKLDAVDDVRVQR